MMPNFQDLTNTKFGRLLVLHRDGTVTPTRWWCKCECGKTISVRASSLKCGDSKSCGCYRSNGSYRMKPDGYSSFVNLYNRYRAQARRRGISFNLNKDTFALLTKQPCYYCGQSPIQQWQPKFPTGAYVYNGIDRLDNTIGYETNNCVPCCGTCNKMKTNQTVLEFLFRIKRIYEIRIKEHK